MSHRISKWIALLLGAINIGVASVRPADLVQVSLSSDIRGTNPGVNRDANTDTVMMHIVEGLVAYREDGSAGPLLADSIRISPDGKTYTFHLRSGVRFPNGAPLTAAEVVWSWQRYLNSSTGWECLADFDGSHGGKIEAVEAMGTDTVVFRLAQPQPLLLVQMAASQCGGAGILHPSSVNPDGTWRAPVATGPYMLGTWKRGQYVELEAFPAYRSRGGPRDGNTGGKVAYASRLRWLVIRDAAARLAALAKGQLDVMPEVPAAEMAQVKHVPGTSLTSKPPLETYAILIQTRDPLMSDIRIRRALALSVDRTAIASLVTNGAGVANPSMIPASSPYHSAAQAAGQEADPARRQILFDQLHAQMLEDCPIIVLYSPADVDAVRSSVRGFDSWAFGRARLWGVRRVEND